MQFALGDDTAAELPTIADGERPAMVGMGSSSMLGHPRNPMSPRLGMRNLSEPSDASFAESRLR